ncbi:unnamed protein product [Rhodiola kirilowii]
MCLRQSWPSRSSIDPKCSPKEINKNLLTFLSNPDTEQSELLHLQEDIPQCYEKMCVDVTSQECMSQSQKRCRTSKQLNCKLETENGGGLGCGIWHFKEWLVLI